MKGPVGKQTPLNALFRNDGAAGFVNVLAKGGPLNARRPRRAVRGLRQRRRRRPDADRRLRPGRAAISCSGTPCLRRSGSAAWASSCSMRGTSHALRRGSAPVRSAGTNPRFAPGGHRRRLQQPERRAGPLRAHVAGPVTVEVTFMTPAGRKIQAVKNVAPADYRGEVVGHPRGNTGTVASNPHPWSPRGWPFPPTRGIGRCPLTAPVEPRPDPLDGASDRPEVGSPWQRLWCGRRPFTERNETLGRLPYRMERLHQLDRGAVDLRQTRRSRPAGTGASGRPCRRRSARSGCRSS